ncbi:hypothetical protein [Paludibacterium sp. B53371]|uniref:hypothetical protein n=1 Tax=Paludibacterium sp. B53371 TaxID=2806263 RepID=UPI001C03F809|nr:hypothetical protein [Paludibacterium sp. B53371]
MAGKAEVGMGEQDRLVQVSAGDVQEIEWSGLSLEDCVGMLHLQQRQAEADRVLRALCLLDWHRPDYLRAMAHSCRLGGRVECAQRLIRLAELLQPAPNLLVKQARQPMDYL